MQATISSQTRTIDQIRTDLESLDLDSIKVKLMDKKEGKGWTLDHANEVERWYKRFLFLTFTHPEQPIVPVGDIDHFWHGHILDTAKYAEDCEKVFGYFLHHFPYFGMRGDDDAANLKRAAEETIVLLEAESGESFSGGAQGCNTCGSSCSSCNGHRSDASTCDKKLQMVRSDERPRLPKNA